MPPTLVGLAAGMGSRFGGPKQLEPLGPAGETMLDFSIYDALRAGFERVVLVIQPGMHEAFERGVAARWRSRVAVELVHQDVNVLPAGVVARPTSRRKPWGTGHAVLAAAPAVDGPFAVVNGDDFYGRAAYESLGAFLRAPQADAIPVYAVVGFPLAETLSEAGSVNRAVLDVTPDGWLSRIEEVLGIEPDGRDGRVRTDGDTRLIAGSTPVSMNMWGLAPDVLTTLAEAFASFLELHGDDDRAEFLLPTHVEELVRRGRARVRVLPGSGPWCGLTHPGDRARAAEVLRAHVERGEYPRPVWR